MDKLKVMIVDDERLIRCGIVSMIKWESIGLQLVGEAADGEEGYRIFLEQQPDIVITDIKMPGLSGIEMIRKIQQHRSDVKYLILSGYEDFSYAKEAIRLGVSDYLLKSDLMPEDIEDILNKMVQEIHMERDSGTAAPDGQTSMRFKNIIFEACHGIRIPDSLELEAEEAGKLSLGYYCFYLGISQNQAVGNRESGYEVLMAFDQLLQENLRKDSYAIFQEGEEALGLVVFGGPAADEHVQRILTAYIQSRPDEGMESGHKRVVTIGCSSYYQGLPSLATAFDEAVRAYRMRMFLGSGRFIRYQTEELVQKASAQKIELLPVEQSLEYHDLNMLKQSIHRVFDCLRAEGDYGQANMVFMELLVMLNGVSERFGKDEVLLEKKRVRYQQLLQLDYIGDLEQWFIHEFALSLEEGQSKLNEKKHIVNLLRQYMDENYALDITLQSLGEMVSLNKNYIGYLFKKEIGKGPIEYLTNTRIQVAKNLLVRTEMTAKEVGERVGYVDERHFYKVFKRITGYTTTDYIETYRQNSENTST